ncbi:MAG: PKD domain-containing protein [Bacteroidota bacterium]|nr:PKD domain-containing protein [Bacteroidota bacterium]
MKKTTFSLFSFLAIAVLTLSMYSCKEDPADPPTVTVFASVDGYQVAFTATVTNADTYSWDFGDQTVGPESTEQNPVHTYVQSGSYTATLTVTGDGGSESASTDVTISASEMEMLTGGSAMANGKVWKLSPTSSEGDGIFKCTADFEFEDPIPDGILGLIGLPTEYEDEFVFHHDMSYTHDVKNDSSVTDIFYALLNGLEFRQSGEDAIVLAPFTPAAATFTYTEDTDLTLTVVDPDDDAVTSELTWSNVNVLEIEGGTEFVAIQDFTRQYMILDIAVDKLQVGIFISTSEDPTTMHVPKHMIVMTLIPAS